MIYGRFKKKMISFEQEEEVIEETSMQLQEQDYFYFVDNGLKMNESVYLIGNDHIHIMNMVTNQT